MAQYDRKYFKKQFEGLPRKASAVIALRAAMRAFPVLAHRRQAADAAFWFWRAEDRTPYMHGICRCFQSSSFVNCWTKAAAEAAAKAAAKTACYAAADAAGAAATNAAAATFAASYAASYAAAAILTDIAQIQRLSRIDRWPRRDGKSSGRTAFSCGPTGPMPKRSSVPIITPARLTSW
jgi:hypothetical protein